MKFFFFICVVGGKFWQARHVIYTQGVKHFCIKHLCETVVIFTAQDLNELAMMVREELPQLIRDVIINLITIDVHARDIVTTLVENKVTSR